MWFGFFWYKNQSQDTRSLRTGGKKKTVWVSSEPADRKVNQRPRSAGNVSQKNPEKRKKKT